MRLDGTALGPFSLLPHPALSGGLERQTSHSHCTPPHPRFTLYSAHREQACPAADLEQDVKDLVHKFQQPDKTVVAYKGGHYEKELLQRWGIPHFNLEQAQCPKFDTMTRLCRPTSCGCHDHPWRHHCPQIECYHFVHWMRGQLGLDRDWNFVNMHRIHSWMACTS